jgi:Na+/H+ antiporter NhaC
MPWTMMKMMLMLTMRTFSWVAQVVVGRTVGIGAYLVRLGQRTIQKQTNAPIILTGLAYQSCSRLGHVAKLSPTRRR